MNWENLWKSMGEIEPKKNYMWGFYELLLNGYSFKKKKVLEIGCGSGTNSLIMGSMGAEITVIDQSKKALEIVKRNSDRLSIDCEFIHGDIFDYNVKNQFNLVHSEGVVEHFLGERRQKIINIHSNVLKRGGYAVIIVPNKNSLPYLIGKSISEKVGVWPYGKEYPYTKTELIYRIKKAGLEIIKVSGGEFIMSFFWLFSPMWLATSRLHKQGLETSFRKNILKLNYGNFFAERWGRIIAAVGKK